MRDNDTKMLEEAYSNRFHDPAGEAQSREIEKTGIKQEKPQYGKNVWRTSDDKITSIPPASEDKINIKLPIDRKVVWNEENNVVLLCHPEHGCHPIVKIIGGGSLYNINDIGKFITNVLQVEINKQIDNPQQVNTLSSTHNSVKKISPGLWPAVYN